MARLFVYGLIAYLNFTPGSVYAATNPAMPVARPIFVDPAAIRCLLLHVDQIPKEPRGVFVEFRDCERDKGVKIVRLLSAPTPPVDPTGIENILFVKPQELSCMKRNRNKINRIIHALPGNRYQLKIKPCGR